MTPWRPVSFGMLALLATAVVGASGQFPVSPPPSAPTGQHDPAGRALQAAADPSGLIAGRVVDGATGALVSAATVTLSGAGVPASRVLTDAAGRFFFDQVRAGTFNLAATKPGWIPGEHGRGRPGGAAVPVEVADHARRSDLTIRLWRYGVISGRVTDDQGDSLVGVDLRVFERTFVAGRPRWTFVTRAITDDRGVYRVSTLSPGDYIVVVPAAVTSEPRDMRGVADAWTTYLRTMTGPVAPMSVGSEATMPVPGGPTLVTSILPLASPPLSDGPWLTHQTTLAPSVSSPAQATVVRVTSGAEQSNVNVTVRFAASYRVSGTITDLDGKPAAFHAVHLLPADAADNPLFDVSTAASDATGVFTFLGVPPGEYVARVVRIPPLPPQQRISTCGGTGAISAVCITGVPGPAEPPSVEPLAFADHPVTVSNTSIRDVRIALRPGVQVAGTARFIGNRPPPAASQLAGIGVRLEPAGGRATPALGPPTGVAENGSFLSPSMWPGRYLLRVTASPSGWTFKNATHQGRDIADTPFDLTSDLSDVVVTFVDEAFALQGAVTQPASEQGKPLIVLLFPDDRARWVDHGLTSRRVRSVGVSDGRFSMPAPPAGDYLLVAIPDEQSASWQNPEVLGKLAGLADRVRVVDGRSMTHALTARKLP